jgi:hypothetical protein
MTRDPGTHHAQAQPDAGASGDGGEFVRVPRQMIDAVTDLIASGHELDERVRAAAYRQGRDAHLSGGYQAGYDLGHDTGLSARQDTRGYVHGILEGFADGTEARHQLADYLLRRDQARHADTRRQPDREAETS